MHCLLLLLVLGLVPNALLVAEEKPSPDDQAKQMAGFIWDSRKKQWLSPSEYYPTRGYVQFQGRWMSKVDQRRLERRQQHLRELSKQRSDWEQAWELKTPHFEITSNCPAVVVNEVALAAEQCYRKLAEVFRLRRLPRRLPIEVFATQEQFAAQTMASSIGFGIGPGTLGYFWSRGEQCGIRLYYPGNIERMLGTLMHECTHLIFHNAANSRRLPQWCNEGLAVLVEEAERGPRGLEIQAIPFGRLWHLQKQLAQGPIDLNDLVQINSSSGYRIEHYPQGWGFTYFLWMS
jgi:hypothetical protein